MPAVVGISLLSGTHIILDLGQTDMVLLVLTLVLSLWTFTSPRTTALHGAMHLVVFCVYVTLIFNP